MDLECFDSQERLLVRLRVLPSDGEANKSLCRWIDRWLGVPKSTINVVSGGKQRNKKILDAGNIDQLKEIIENRTRELAQFQ